jgi:hypothetical protein
MMMRGQLFATALIGAATFGVGTDAVAQSGFVPVPAEGVEWCRNAETFLFNRAEKRPFRCATDRTPHCVKLNNYGCLKHGPANPYAGTPAPNGRQGAHDGRDGSRGHAIFEHPKWSVAGSFRWFERNFKERGLRTAAQLANRYSPWCDTHGSVALKKDSVTGHRWGRTCGDGQKPPPGFAGPFCKEPAGAPTAEQCRVCNCPSVFVTSWLKGTDIKPTDPLDLFGPDGKPTKMMERILVNHTPWEIGYRPSEALIAEGARLFEPKP